MSRGKEDAPVPKLNSRGGEAAYWLFSVPGVVDGHWHRCNRVVKGFSPSGLNVNNNNYDNDNYGVAFALRKSC